MIKKNQEKNLSCAIFISFFIIYGVKMAYSTARAGSSLLDWGFLEGIGTFLGKVITKHHEIGSLFPSSQWLAEKMVSEIHPGSNKKMKRFLEIGAGSGAITEAILPLLGPRDTLDIIECDQDLANSVQKMVNASGMANRVKVHTVYAQDFKTDRKYDHIISSLPLTSFSHELVQKIYTKIDGLIKQRGKFTYFEYMALGTIRQNILYVTDRESYKNLDRVITVKKTYCEAKPRKVQRVFANFPPARVVHLLGN